MIKRILVVVVVLFCLINITSCTKNRCKVIFMVDGTIVKEEIVKKGESATAPIPEKEGHTFVSWDKEFDIVNDSMIVRAIFEINKFTVTFKKEGKVIKEQVVEYGNSAIPPKILQLNEKFLGWDKEFDNVTSDLEVNAIFEPLMTNVTFMVDGEIYKEYIINSGTKLTTWPKSPIKEGYTFVGWKDENGDLLGIFDHERLLAGDVVYEAKWKLNEYTVFFYVNDITKMEYKKVKHNECVAMPTTIPEIKGYDFIEWQYNGVAYDFDTPVTDNMVIIATFTLCKYLNVSFDTNDGNKIADQIVERGTTMDVPESPVREKHIFYGWYKDSALTEEFDFDTKIEQDMTLYAKWIFVSDTASEASVKSAMNSYKLYKDGSFEEYANSLNDFVKNAKASRYSNYTIELSNIYDCFGISYPDRLYYADANQDYTFEVKLIYTYQPKNYSKPVLIFEFILDTDLYVFDYLWCDTQNYNDGVMINEGMITFTVTGNYVISLYLKAEFTNYVDINCEDVQAFENSDNYMATYRLMNEEEYPYIGTFYNIVVE